MQEKGNLKFGVDLITLYDPSWWGLDDFNKFYDKSALPPEVFWDKALDTVAESGITGIELSFGPGYWKNAMERYGSASAFMTQIKDRGLEICSGFNTDLVLKGTDLLLREDWESEAYQKELYDRTADYAEFLAECGCDIMIVGLPLRKSWDAESPMFVDHELASGLANIINRMGYIAEKRGVRVAIHPETHAVLWFKRDIDLFLSLTDPVYVNFCPDTAHITTGGGNPVEIARNHRGRVIISHWKDGLTGVPVKYPIDENIFRSHHPFFQRVGVGQVDWASWARMLRDTNFEGWAIIELDAAPNPPKTMAAAKHFVDTTISPIYC